MVDKHKLNKWIPFYRWRNWGLKRLIESLLKFLRQTLFSCGYQDLLQISQSKGRKRTQGNDVEYKCGTWSKNRTLSAARKMVSDSVSPFLLPLFMGSFSPSACGGSHPCFFLFNSVLLSWNGHTASIIIPIQVCGHWTTDSQGKPRGKFVLFQLSSWERDWIGWAFLLNSFCLLGV